ncbi:MAG: hypothetical protein KFF73_16840 [Cyclobacteriaceae bacterium]|nr:hypothetical protein [Cyclobacteriaceae bacterium]
MIEKKSGPAGKKAVVIGASMAGLLAARVMADHFEQVIMLERDRFPEPGSNRKGVPQGKHTHVFLERGRQIMETYFPGLTSELTGKGAVWINDASNNVSWFHSGDFHKQGQSGISGIGVSRPTLETSVRLRVSALSNVMIMEKCRVLELIPADSNQRISGIRFFNSGKDAETTLMADLVVDASGRGSRSPAWMEKLGYQPPEVEKIKIDMGYTTCHFHRKPDHIPGRDGIVFLATPPEKRLGVILAQDRDRWVVTIGGYLGDHAPTDYPGFLQAVRDLPSPEIYHVIKDEVPLEHPVPYKFTANQRHHYEKLPDFPEGYLVLGDALCSFNPIYGQGMTVAAMEAGALDSCLENGLYGLAGRFFTKASKIIDLAWDSAVGNDLSYPEVKGSRTLMIRFLNWYIKKLHIAAHKDAAVSIAFLKVINMVAPPPSMMHPGIIWRILKHNFVPTIGSKA